MLAGASVDGTRMLTRVHAEVRLELLTQQHWGVKQWAWLRIEGAVCGCSCVLRQASGWWSWAVSSRGCELIPWPCPVFPRRRLDTQPRRLRQCGSSSSTVEMQTFLRGRRVGYWLSDKKMKKLNFQAFADLCRYVVFIPTLMNHNRVIWFWFSGETGISIIKEMTHSQMFFLSLSTHHCLSVNGQVLKAFYILMC